MSSHYDFIIHSDKISFQTKSGINYSCIFILDEEKEQLGLNIKASVFQFVFFPDKPQRDIIIKNDSRIHLTIVKILQEFFIKNKDGIILYFCDDTDSKGKARHNLFEKWLKQYNDLTPKKNLFNLSVFESDLYISLIINENHSEMDKLIEMIKKQVEELKKSRKSFSTNINNQ